MSAPALVGVAHGSRDPRSAATMARLVAEVRALRPDLDVRLGFLELSAPRLDAVLADVGEAVVLPLLLGTAHHVCVDVPAAVASARVVNPTLDVRVGPALGPDHRLEDTALHRLVGAGADPDDQELGVVLGANGSSRAEANAAVVAVADRLAARTRWRVRAAFASAAPSVADAAAELLAAGAGRIALGSWFLAPGLIPDRMVARARAVDPTMTCAAPLGPAPALAELIIDRYETVAATVVAA